MVNIAGKEYALEFDPKDKFVVEGLIVAFSDELASDYMPVIYDPNGHGSCPFPPEFVAYRLVMDPKGERLCIIYEVYWKRQDCTWKELNKDHDHDYEQVQVHFDLSSSSVEKVVVSSTGPIENGGHGVEVFSNVSKASFKTVVYTTASSKSYPWGGDAGQNTSSQVREIPIGQLLLENGRPPIVVLNCYHAFSGLKRSLLPEEKILLSPELRRLDMGLIDKWYYLNASNKFGHDVSKPFEEPFIMYFPPPEDWASRLAYGFLWFVSVIKRGIGL